MMGVYRFLESKDYFANLLVNRNEYEKHI